MRISSLIICISCFSVGYSQVVLNGYFNAVDSNTYYIYDSLTGHNTRPYVIVKPKQVSFNGFSTLLNSDSILNCPTPPFCIMFQPVNFTHSLFAYSQVIMKLSSPLDSGVAYTIRFAMRIYYPTSDVVPRDPWMGVKLSKDSIIGLDQWDHAKAPSLLANAPGNTWYFPWNKNADQEWHELEGTIRAVGGERYLYFGIIHDRAPLRIGEIMQVDKHMRKWIKNGKIKHMQLIRKVYDLWSVDQVGDSELIEMLQTVKTDSSIENPSYLIDDVIIEKAE